MIQFPKHECSLTLQHNAHKDYYQTVADYIEGNEWFVWISDEAKQQALDTNEIWTLHWYPATPIGSYAMAAATLQELLDFVNSNSR